MQISEEEGSAPANVSKPSVEGTGSVGAKLTCSRGVWSGSPEPTFEFEWVRAVGGVESSIVRGVSSTYTVVGADQGASLSCVVFAKNELGSAHQASSNVVKVPGEAPRNVRRPTVAPAGEVKAGETLTCSSGEWAGVPAPTFAYEWLLNGTVEVAAGYSYAVPESDEGGSLVCRVVALNSAGEKEAVSEPVRVTEGAPENVSAPKVTPEAAGVGETLTCEHGSWTHSPSEYRYQWLSEGAVISGATKSSYVVVVADEKHSLSCEVVAVNAGGNSATKVSSNSVKVSVSKPVDKTVPVVEGEAVLAKQLTCGHGEWSGEPTFSYQWLRSGTEIAGATGVTYTVLAADQLHTLSCRVTAKNAGGTASKESASTSEVPGSKPQNTGAPEISGTPKVEQTLTCSSGKWSGVPETITFSYQWLLEGKAITGATKASYFVPVADKGKSLSCEVTATNSAGADGV